MGQLQPVGSAPSAFFAFLTPETVGGGSGAKQREEIKHEADAGRRGTGSKGHASEDRWGLQQAGNQQRNITAIKLNNSSLLWVI